MRSPLVKLCTPLYDSKKKKQKRKIKYIVAVVLFGLDTLQWGGIKNNKNKIRGGRAEMIMFGGTLLPKGVPP